MDYFMPARLHTGNDCVFEHRDEIARLGKLCLIVTEGLSATASGALADVTRALDSCSVGYSIWDGVTPNPPLASCAEAGRLAAEAGAEFVLGIGGGSALDAAKATAVFAANPSLDEAGFYGMRWDGGVLPIVLVGTTAGTGSEVTKVSVLTDSHARKHSIHEDRLYATLSLGDSRYTSTCPPGVILSCGIDVFAHAAESYFSRKADEITRAFSVRAIRLGWKPLAAAAAGEGLSDEQRRELYEASILGGLAINTTGTCFPHNVGYYLTETYGLPHGFASATFMPAMLVRVREADPAYAAAFYSEIGHGEDELRELVGSCLPDNGIRMSEAEIDAALPRWKNNGSVKNTRADITQETIHEILVDLFVR